MAEKRKSAFKRPYRCRRNRISTPDLLSPYLPGPELFISPHMLTIQTRPAYSTARSDSSLSSVSSFLIGYSPFANPMATPDSNLIPSSSGSFYTESSVVEDLSVRLTAQSVLPPHICHVLPTVPLARVIKFSFCRVAFIHLEFMSMPSFPPIVPTLEGCDDI